MAGPGLLPGLVCCLVWPEACLVGCLAWTAARPVPGAIKPRPCRPTFSIAMHLPCAAVLITAGGGGCYTPPPPLPLAQMSTVCGTNQITSCRPLLVQQIMCSYMQRVAILRSYLQRVAICSCHCVSKVRSAFAINQLAKLQCKAATPSLAIRQQGKDPMQRVTCYSELRLLKEVQAKSRVMCETIHLPSLLPASNSDVPFASFVQQQSMCKPSAEPLRQSSKAK